MSQQRSLSVSDPVWSDFNALKIRIASSRDNRIPVVGDVIAAMLIVTNAHYDELLTALTARENR